MTCAEETKTSSRVRGQQFIFFIRCKRQCALKWRFKCIQFSQWSSVKLLICATEEKVKRLCNNKICTGPTSYQCCYNQQSTILAHKPGWKAMMLMLTHLHNSQWLVIQPSHVEPSLARSISITQDKLRATKPCKPQQYSGRATATADPLVKTCSYLLQTFRQWIQWRLECS